MMNRKQIVFFVLLCAFAAVAEEIPSTLSNFTSGETISSATMNAHFDAVETAVDDNAADIDALQAVDPIEETEMDSQAELETQVGATFATDAELAAKSSASSTDNAVARFDSTAGDVQNSGVTIDDSNNLTVPGSITAGGTEVPTCLILRDSDDAGDSACEVLNGTFSCETDTNGVCGDAT